MQMIGLARLGRDADIRTAPTGHTVANLSLAVNYGKKGDDGKKPTQWIEGSLWDKPAEALGQYLTKGKLVCVTLDDVHIEEYEHNGQARSKLVARVSKIELAGDGSHGGAPQQQRGTFPAPSAVPRQAPRPAQGFDDMDDDIPF